MAKYLILISLLTWTVFFDVLATEENNVFQMGSQYELEYSGAIRFKNGTFGTSRLGFANGTIAVKEDLSGVFIAGHLQHFSVGEFELNEFVDSSNIDTLPISNVIQAFVSVRPESELTEPHNRIDRVTGLDIIDNKLFVNVAEYYDGAGTQTATTVVFEDHTNLLTDKKGYFELTGGVFAGGWLATLPAQLATEFGYPNIVGHASNLSINSRLSQGPTLYFWDPGSFNASDINEDSSIFTEKVFSYPLDKPLGSYGSTTIPEELEMWNELSFAAFGFFSDSGEHYIVIGQNSGMNSGIAYKITNNIGFECGGYCAYDAEDTSNFFWLYSTDDIRRVIKNELQPEDIQPIEFGILPTKYPDYPIIGVDYLPKSHQLYILKGSADTFQSRFESLPILEKYTLNGFSDNTSSSNILKLIMYAEINNK